MFILDKDRLLKLYMNRRIIVNATIFYKINLNYLRLEIKKLDIVDFFFE